MMRMDILGPEATQQSAHGHNAPAYVISIGGRDITANMQGLMMSLTLTESRGDEADQLDIELDDSAGRLALPPAGERIALQLGWQDKALIDKGDYVVDEVEHRGAPDVLCIRARSADLRQDMRTRREQSHHGQTLGQIVQAVTERHGLRARIARELAALAVAHVDQTHESDLHFLTRLARRHDAVATIKKGTLIFARINSQTTADGARLPAVVIVRADGDQHRWHRADRDAYTSVRAQWQDNAGARKRSVTAGEGQRVKRLRDIHGTQADAQAAARAEMQRIQRGTATLEITLAHARPDIAPQSTATMRGWHKPEIDDAAWLVKTCTHSLQAGGGFTTRLELQTQGSDATVAADD